MDAEYEMHEMDFEYVDFEEPLEWVEFIRELLRVDQILVYEPDSTAYDTVYQILDRFQNLSRELGCDAALTAAISFGSKIEMYQVLRGECLPF